MKPTALILAVASAYSEGRIEDSAIKSLGIAERKGFRHTLNKNGNMYKA